MHKKIQNLFNYANRIPNILAAIYEAICNKFHNCSVHQSVKDFLKIKKKLYLKKNICLLCKEPDYVHVVVDNAHKKYKYICENFVAK